MSDDHMNNKNMYTNNDDAQQCIVGYKVGSEIMWPTTDNGYLGTSLTDPSFTLLFGPQIQPNILSNKVFDFWQQ